MGMFEKERGYIIMGMKKNISEFLGTMLLVLVGTGTVVVGNQDPLTIALSFGLTVMMMAYAVGGISGGHFNPAVTLAMVINKRISIKDALQYVLSQFLGAVIGSSIIYLFVKDMGLEKGMMGQNDLGSLSAMSGILIEIIVTFIFVFVILMITSNKYNVGNIAPVVIGLTLTMLIVLTLNTTGGSLNPARSLGPAIYAHGTALSNYWVFLIGPLVGAAIAAVFANYLDSEEK